MPCLALPLDFARVDGHACGRATHNQDLRQHLRYGALASTAMVQRQMVIISDTILFCTAHKWYCEEHIGGLKCLQQGLAKMSRGMHMLSTHYPHRQKLFSRFVTIFSLHSILL